MHVLRQSTEARPVLWMRCPEIKGNYWDSTTNLFVWRKGVGHLDRQQSHSRRFCGIAIASLGKGGRQNSAMSFLTISSTRNWGQFLLTAFSPFWEPACKLLGHLGYGGDVQHKQKGRNTASITTSKMRPVFTQSFAWCFLLPLTSTSSLLLEFQMATPVWGVQTSANTLISLMISTSFRNWSRNSWAIWNEA